MKSVLLAWLGQTDMDLAERDDPRSPGPTASVLAARTFDALVLLSNYPAGQTKAYVKWLEGRGAPPIHLLREELDDPTDYSKIHDAVVRSVESVRSKFGEDVRLSIHVSPGTPAMQAIWVLLAKTRYPAELLQSHAKTGVRTVSIPFDISAEFVPDLFRTPDEKLQRLSEGLPPEAPEFSEILRRSAPMERAVARARRIAPRNLPVLLEGESGTGKELFARAIHAASPRASKRFEPVNCGALPKDLLESLLFGHEKGAFTGATRQHKGYFEAADGGTLFLDEVGELPLEAQVRLLRVLQERRVRRVGSEQSIKIDVRIIAATNRNLRVEVAGDRFRDDLYHRLAVGTIYLPPLRDRAGDLGLLIDRLLEAANLEMADQPGYVQKLLSPSARNLLLKHPWPGNVRELQNTLRRLVLWTQGERIGGDEVRDELVQPDTQRTADLLGRPLGDGLQLPELMRELACHYLERAMEESGGNKTKGAELIGLPSYQTLTNWMNRYGVKVRR